MSAAEAKAEAERVYEAMRGELAKRRVDVDSDPAVLIARTNCEEAQAAYDAAFAAYRAAEAPETTRAAGAGSLRPRLGERRSAASSA